MDKIVLIGFGGHAKSVVDAIENTEHYEIAGFTDSNEKLNYQYKQYRVIGTDANATEIFQKGIKNAFISIGYMGQSRLRNELYKYYKQIGYEFPTIIDESAILASDCKVGEGTFIGKNAVINANATVGRVIIINSGAIIEHDVAVGDFSHVAVGATVCGGCQVGNGCLIGAGSVILQGITIGDNAVIGAGAVVTRDVESGKTVVGVPASELIKKEEI